MKNKTVYILGAGFSKEAGAPMQDKLVEEIFNVQENDENTFEKGKFSSFQKFLTKTLNISEHLIKKVPLEDIFTPLDKCLSDNISFRNMSIDEVKETRETIYYLIGKTLQKLLNDSTKKYVKDFAEYLVKLCEERKGGRYPEIDKVSVISTNWDLLLDNAIKDILDYRDDSGTVKAVVDYCCHVSSFEKDDHSIKPGLEVLGLGGFNVKLLKIHGSFNWLQCPRCLRVYIHFNKKIAVDQYLLHEKCRHCQENFEEESELMSNLIMPTFLKNFSNPQYKIIWQNAGIELSEAERIVFIGYSLPYADFEMRQLLSRMVRKNALIEVVDYAKDDKGKLIPELQQRYIETQERYKIFFGGRTIDFFDRGAKHYIKNNLK